ILVVLTDEEHRKIPNRRHIHSLVKNTFIHGAITEEAGCNIRLPQILERQRISSGERNASTNNCDGRKHSPTGIPHVHRAALATTTPCALGEQLSHQEFHWDAAGDGVFVRTMGTRQHVTVMECLADTDGTRLLPLSLMNRPRHSSLKKQRIDSIFEHPTK